MVARRGGTGPTTSQRFSLRGGAELRGRWNRHRVEGLQEELRSEGDAGTRAVKRIATEENVTPERVRRILR